MNKVEVETSSDFLISKEISSTRLLRKLNTNSFSLKLLVHEFYAFVDEFREVKFIALQKNVWKWAFNTAR